MSDRIAVMNHGKIEQVGKSCSEIFENPRTEFVANFIGATNIFEGEISDGVMKMKQGPSFQLQDGKHNGPAKFSVRPEKMILSTQEMQGRVCLNVTVVDEIFQGTNTSWVVQYADKKFTVIEQNSKEVQEAGRFARGDRALLCWNPKHTVILE